jgi:cytosine/uracil/thiamine/allantoin permease
LTLHQAAQICCESVKLEIINCTADLHSLAQRQICRWRSVLVRALISIYVQAFKLLKKVLSTNRKSASYSMQQLLAA